jgi:membrane protein YdbS with pleckstrin-like domain
MVYNIVNYVLDFFLYASKYSCLLKLDQFCVSVTLLSVLRVSVNQQTSQQFDSVLLSWVVNIFLSILIKKGAHVFWLWSVNYLFTQVNSCAPLCIVIIKISLFLIMLQYTNNVCCFEHENLISSNTSISSVDKKNPLDVTFCIFVSLLLVVQHVSGNHVPITRRWRLRDVIASCWYVL